MGLRGLVLMLAGRNDEAQPVLLAAASALRAPQPIPWDPAGFCWLAPYVMPCWGNSNKHANAGIWGQRSPDYPTVRLVYLGGLKEVRKALTTTRLDALMESLTMDAH
jgi:hypothetical protein